MAFLECNFNRYLSHTADLIDRLRALGYPSNVYAEPDLLTYWYEQRQQSDVRPDRPRFIPVVLPYREHWKQLPWSHLRSQPFYIKRAYPHSQPPVSGPAWGLAGPLLRYQARGWGAQQTQNS